MADFLSNLRLFIRVARSGSLSRAARETGLSQSGVSRALTALEHEVGGPLLTRTTRKVGLTEAGAEYLARIEPLIAGLDEAAEGIRSGNELRGLLRIAMPTGIATREIIPKLPRFTAKHPNLRIELHLEDRLQDLLQDEVDVAIRFGKMPASNAISRPFGVNERVLVASPNYIAHAPKLEHPTQIANHAWIAGPVGPSPRTLIFERGSEQLEVRVRGRIQATVNEGAVGLAVAGLGIVSTGLWGCRAELADARLVRLLPEWNLGMTEVHAFLAAGKRSKLSARAFADYLVEQYR